MQSPPQQTELQIAVADYERARALRIQSEMRPPEDQSEQHAELLRYLNAEEEALERVDRVVGRLNRQLTRQIWTMESRDAGFRPRVADAVCEG
jgi:hypothetical protein